MERHTNLAKKPVSIDSEDDNVDDQNIVREGASDGVQQQTQSPVKTMIWNIFKI